MSLINKDSAWKIRVPHVLKQAVIAYAEGKLLTESDVIREAVMEYLAARGVKVNHPSPTAKPAMDNTETLQMLLEVAKSLQAAQAAQAQATQAAKLTPAEEQVIAKLEAGVKSPPVTRATRKK
jgi:hypothetical protein